MALRTAERSGGSALGWAKPVVTSSFKEQLAPIFFTFDNKKLYVSSNRGRDKAAIFVFNPVTGKEEDMLFEHPEVDVSALSFSRKRKVLTTISFTTWKTERKFLDKESEAMFKMVEAKLSGYEINFTSTNRAEDKYIVATFNDKTRGKRYLYDKATKK